ncbi:MAG: RidA family protein [Alphaproteobacteria bacterium]|nr:RidA family protein [Alphaproteobacteria bacterium]
MPGTRIRSGSIWEDRASYARAVVLPDPGGDWVLVSGTTGYDYATGAISDDPAAQARQCFANIERALAQAGAGLEDLVRIRVIVTSVAVFDAIIDVVGEHCRSAMPANTTIVAGLVAPEMLVEIEVTARKRPA